MVEQILSRFAVDELVLALVRFGATLGGCYAVSNANWCGFLGVRGSPDARTLRQQTARECCIMYCGGTRRL